MPLQNGRRRNIQMSSALKLAGAAIFSILMTGAATANDLIIKYDQSQLLRLPRAVAEVIIGNASIADVNVKTSTLLVVTGKSFGITNIIALDANQNVIQDQRVIVQRDEVSVVNVQLGSARRSFNCSPQCNPTITVGDDEKFLDSVASTSLKKMRVSESAQSGASASSE